VNRDVVVHIDVLQVVLAGKPAKLGFVVLHTSNNLLLDPFIFFFAGSFELDSHVVMIRIAIIVVVAIRDHIFTAPENSAPFVILKVSKLVAFVMYIRFERRIGIRPEFYEFIEGEILCETGTKAKSKECEQY
jgi:hypothetical protein